ncbi:MAG: histidine kinase N-terminal 7TM domain-containing protein [Caldilinea sp.]
MSWSFGTVSYVYTQTALFALAVAFFAWRRRSTPGAWPLAGILTAAALWAAAEAVESAAPTLETKILVSQVSHIGIQALPVFFLLFVLRFSRNSAGFLRQREHCLWLAPVLAVLAAFTNDAHHLFWRRVELVQSPLGLESVYHHGPLFWASTTYLYILILTATFILMRRMISYQDVYRRQAGVLIAATAAPWLANIVYLSGLNPLPGFDWTPLAFIVTGILLAWAIFRIGLLDLRPIARSALFEQMGDVLLVTDAQGRVVDANPAAYHFFSANGALVGRSVDELLPTDLFHVSAKDHGEAVAVLTRNSATCQLDVRITQLSEPDGVSNGRLIVLRDTTDRMHMEQSLRRSEQRYRTLVDNAPFPSIVCTVEDGALRYANFRACDLLAIEPDDMARCHLPDFFAVRSEGEQALALMRTQEVADQEAQLRSNAGDEFPALLSTVTITYSGEEAILASINDITVQRQAEQALIDARVEAESALRAKSEFLSTMSHELRTPLSSVIGLAEALQSEAYGSLNERQQHSLETIVQSSGRLAKLLKDVLDLSRLEAGAVELNRETTAIDELCRGALSAVHAMRTQDAPPLLYAIQPADLTMAVDPRRLRQILIHLLSNAIKFTPADHRIGLEVMADPEQGIAHFAVWDEGIGIEQERQYQLFRPFAQLDSGLARRYEGMGIGLAIVRHIADLHGGQVTVVSEPGKGSRFTVTLPIAPP